MLPPRLLFHETTHWFARGLSVVLLIFTAGVLYGNGLPNPAQATRVELFLYAAFFFMMAGAALGMRFERLGGWMLVIAFSLFWVVNSIVTRSFPVGVMFLLYGIAGALYLLSWSSEPHPARPARPRHVIRRAH